jgi:hypothetical protein
VSIDGGAPGGDGGLPDMDGGISTSDGGFASDFGVFDMGPLPDGFLPPSDLGMGDMDIPDLLLRCVPVCSTDADCQTSCPPNPNPTLPVCCDTGTATCFNSSVPMCPPPSTTDAGIVMSM